MNEALQILMEDEPQGAGWGGWWAYNLQDCIIKFMHVG